MSIQYQNSFESPRWMEVQMEVGVEGSVVVLVATVAFMEEISTILCWRSGVASVVEVRAAVRIMREAWKKGRVNIVAFVEQAR